MNKPIIEVHGLSKVYNIGHETKAAPGTVTLRDAISSVAKKPMELLTGHKLKKEKFWALKDINFNIEQGDVVGIIGRNGSGKSTLLKILSRIVEPTTGEIIMRGKSASLLEVGTGFHPELTGRENIYFNGSILGMKKKEIEAKFDEIVAFSEVEKFLDTPVKFYSSGMYVRLAFSVAAHLEPDILIVDEVLAVGDTAFQKKCLGKMKDVAGQGRTVLFVSHNLSAIRGLCTTGIFLDKGKLQYVGEVNELVDKYLESTTTRVANETIKLNGPLAKSLSINKIIINDTINKRAVIGPEEDIRMKVEYKISTPISSFQFSIGLFKDDQRIATLHYPNKPSNIQSDGSFTVQVPKYLLRPGEYYLGVGGEVQKTGDWAWCSDADNFIIKELWDDNNPSNSPGLINIYQ